VKGCKDAPQIRLFFSEHLRDLLRGRDHKGMVVVPLTRKASVKDIVEALGVPHTEVEEISTDGRSVGFDFIPDRGLEITVAGNSTPTSPLVATLLRPEPLSEIRFIVDVNVGKLASLLRLIGFDTRYDRKMDDAEIATLARDEKRIVLTRDRALLKRGRVTFGHLVRAVRPMDQLAEILRHYGLEGPFHYFSRCTVCNSRLLPVDKTDIFHRLEPKTKRYYHTFSRCPGCRRIYWHGSHCAALCNRLRQAGLPAPG
jgi:uncharacterized protein with PIN domain